MWNYFSTKYWTPDYSFRRGFLSKYGNLAKNTTWKYQGEKVWILRKPPKRFSLQSEDFEGNKTVCSWLFRRGFAMIALFIGCLLAQGMPWKLRCSCFDTLLHQWWSTREPSDFHNVFVVHGSGQSGLSVQNQSGQLFNSSHWSFWADGFILGVGIDILCLNYLAYISFSLFDHCLATTEKESGCHIATACRENLSRYRLNRLDWIG